MNDYYKKCAFPKPQIKKKERARVTPETYDKVFYTCKGRCQLCGSTQMLEEHHIRYRSERKDLINDYTNLILLCVKCHKKVHANKDYWQPILLEKARVLYGI